MTDSAVSAACRSMPWHAWRDAAARPAIADAIAALYRELDAAVQARGPTCWLSGRCCNFDAFGHRLYVTGLEIAWLLRQRPLDAHAAGSGCPFQQARLCGVHAIRPMGCRIFFCQEGTAGWQHEFYESFLARLRGLHDDHAIDYRYMEWRAGLADAARDGAFATGS